MNPEKTATKASTGIDWSATIWAGIIAGLVFMMLEMGLVWLALGDSPWGPPHMIAAIALGKDVLPPPGTWAPFDMKIMVTAMMIHLPLSIVLGMMGGILFRGVASPRAMMIGAAFGAAIYVVSFYLIAPIAFPWFVMARNWVGLISHVMFGLVLGAVYAALRERNNAV